MASKREAREERRALKQQQFEAAKEKLVAAVALERIPKLSDDLTLEERLTPVTDKALDALRIPKQPTSRESGSRHHLMMSWCLRRQDTDGHWSWGDPRLWSKDEQDGEIVPTLVQLSALTWAEIEQQSSDTRHKMHHGHEVGDLVKEAQERWMFLGLEQFDTLFRFRMGNLKRAWGFVIKGHFFMIWWDRQHRIYETQGS